MTYYSSTQSGASTATCPSGDTVISGGFQSSTGASAAYDGPNGANGWSVKFEAKMSGVSSYLEWTGNVYNVSQFDSGQGYAQAICASPASS